MESDIKVIKDQVSKLTMKLDSIQKELAEIKSEIGSNSGDELHRQIDKLLATKGLENGKINGIERDVSSIRTTVDVLKENMNQVMQAIAVIYRNTDELEANIIGEERETK